MGNLQNILKLSIAERLLLIEKIWDSIPSDQLSVTDNQKIELDRRIKRLRSGETKFFTWEEVRKNLRK